MNMIAKTMVAVLIASGLVLSTCAGCGASADLNGSSWNLVYYGPTEKQMPAAVGIQTRLDFGTDGTVSGNMGCNSFGGNFEVKNGKIVFSQMVSTMMACQGPQMDQESGVLRVLTGTVSFQVVNNTLTIHDVGGANSIVLAK